MLYNVVALTQKLEPLGFEPDQPVKGKSGVDHKFSFYNRNMNTAVEYLRGRLVLIDALAIYAKIIDTNVRCNVVADDFSAEATNALRAYGLPKFGTKQHEIDALCNQLLINLTSLSV